MTDGIVNEAPRDGLPWTPEEDLLILAEEPTPTRAFEAFAAIQRLRKAAINVVGTYADDYSWQNQGADGDWARTPLGSAVAELEEALLLGIEPD